MSDEMMEENSLLKEFLMAEIKERRRKRRWGVFFKLIFWGYLTGILFVIFSPASGRLDGVIKAGAKPEPFTAVIEVLGEIADNKEANSANIIDGLNAAFDDKNTKGVILKINSPGGSAVQASDVYNAIMLKRKAYPDVKVYAVVTDLGASAAYFIASAADKIYANPASLVGSIGVLIDGFGATELMNKIGIERRLITAGDHKGFLDPFSAVKPEDQAVAETMIKQIHEFFIKSVKAGRGNRLKDDPTLFSGLIWTGMQAKDLGLIDDFASLEQVAKDVIGAERMVTFGPETDILKQFTQRFGLMVGQGAVGALHQQAKAGLLLK